MTRPPSRPTRQPSRRATRVAALYDVHGNLPALEAVLAALEDDEPDVVLVGGDVVSGPMPRETLDLGEDGLERREVPVHVVERGDAQRVTRRW